MSDACDAFRNPDHNLKPCNSEQGNARERYQFRRWVPLDRIGTNPVRLRKGHREAFSNDITAIALEG